MSALRVVYARGEADVQTVSGLMITLLATLSSPPGSRLHGKMPSGLELQVKVSSCKKQEGERFLIAGRVLNATQAVLCELEAKP